VRAVSVTSMISIASVNVTFTGAGNLQLPGFFGPVDASSDRLAAPSQYQSRRAFVEHHFLAVARASSPANAASGVGADDDVRIVHGVPLHWLVGSVRSSLSGMRLRTVSTTVPVFGAT